MGLCPQETAKFLKDTGSLEQLSLLATSGHDCFMSSGHQRVLPTTQQHSALHNCFAMVMHAIMRLERTVCI